jgi:hypothetical protein
MQAAERPSAAEEQIAADAVGSVNVFPDTGR